MSQDQMTPLERFAAYGQGQPIDRLPCVPIVGNTAARVIGVKVSALSGNGPLLAQAQIAAYKRFRYDTIRIFTDLYVMAEAMGAKVFYPEDETAYLAEPAIADISQLDRLLPVNPWHDGQLPQHLEAMKIAVAEVGREVPVTGALTGPFTSASFLVGAETLVRLVRKKPETVHRLCALTLESCLRYAEAIIATGAAPSLTEPMASTTLISPGQFQEFCLPYLRKLTDYIHSRGKSVTLHVCGKTAKIWPLMAEAGADCISIDNAASLLDAKLLVGEKLRLMGNVKPSEIMLQGTAKDVRLAVLAGVQEAYDNPRGYIVASGCSLPTETPLVNIDAMLAAVREIGWPISPESLDRIKRRWSADE